MVRALTVLLAASLVAGCLAPAAPPRPLDPAQAAPPAGQPSLPEAPAGVPAGVPPAAAPPGLPAPRLRCPVPGGPCNLLATLEPERQGNEVHVAVNPRDPGHVVATAKDYYPPHAGECVWNGVYVTRDGGASFASASMPGSPWALLRDPASFQPQPFSHYWCFTDPVVAFGPDGTLYHVGLAIQGDPVTGSSLGYPESCALEQVPAPFLDLVACKGLNDIPNRASIVVGVSRDGGTAWDSFSLVETGAFPVNLPDRPWIDVDPETGVIHVVWTTFLAVGNVAVRSLDGGATWEQPVLLNSLPSGITGPFSLFVVAGPEGRVVVSGCQPGAGPRLAVSRDGGATFGPWRALLPEGDPLAEDAGMEAPYRSPSVCVVAADRGQGPHRGSLYVAWTSTRDGSRDVFLQALHATELEGEGPLAPAMAPVKLNDDQGAADQFFPALGVSPGGAVDAVWVDRRLGSGDVLDLYHATSADGGRTWSANFRVTEASSDPTLSKHQSGFPFIGDYIGVGSTAECAWPVWVDTRAGKADVMVACVERPGDARP